MCPNHTKALNADMLFMDKNLFSRYDKKTSDRKESEQYMEGLKQLGSFNTVEAGLRDVRFGLLCLFCASDWGGRTAS